ncbi:hypothetical protein IHE55_00660 [Streptomyces pactum]|uniref:Secreted protein n=1 Tax=Streptomyces pactum TaxID=68249 RepID=A0ABS0NE08_9ACTN|nr:hypothetical protein [Streptomyces pactum]MBH5333391.1 hypothetical protein [Streptomyces pactum]
MSGVLVAIIIALIVVLIVAYALRTARRRKHLQDRFGPEYARTVEARDSRLAAERDLSRREARHAKLDIKPLPAEVRERYAQDWSRVQQRFVDSPEHSVEEADRLVTALMRERGYPTEGYEQQVRDLSVEHGRTLEHYRAAHEVNVRRGRGEATTEELRGALVHYRALFGDLLQDESTHAR